VTGIHDFLFGAETAVDDASQHMADTVGSTLHGARDDWYNDASFAAAAIPKAIDDQVPAAQAAASSVAPAAARGLAGNAELIGRGRPRPATTIGEEIRHEGPAVHRAMAEIFLADRVRRSATSARRSTARSTSSRPTSRTG
jgi:hypothetical protein